VAYLRFSDENCIPRSLDQQLLNVLNRARRDGVFVPWCYVLADAAVSGTLACRTGYTLAKTIVERRDEFGVAWFLIDDLSRMSRNTIELLRLVNLKDTHGNLVITRKNTIEKVIEIDPEAAEWTRRGAEMIAYEGKSAVDVARLFNEHKVGGKQTWSDGRVRQQYARERLVDKDVLHKSRQVTDRQTGKKKIIYLPKSEWIWRDVPHLRILSDELANAVLEKLGLGAESFGRKAKNRKKKAYRVDLYPKVLIRPICGGCGNPMILGQSDDKYQSFFCCNVNNGIKGCTNRGYKSAKIVDDAMLGAVMAQLFTEGSSPT